MLLFGVSIFLQQEFFGQNSVNQMPPFHSNWRVGMGVAHHSEFRFKQIHSFYDVSRVLVPELAFFFPFGTMDAWSVSEEKLSIIRMYYV